MMSSTFLS